MAVHHVEVTLVDRDVDRLAHGTARVMHAGAHVGEFYEVSKILDRSVPPTTVEVAHEWRPVCRHQHRPLAANNDVAIGISCMLRVLGRCGRLDNRPAEATREAHALAVDFGAGFLEKFERLGKFTKLDADFLKDRVGIIFDRLQAFPRPISRSRESCVR